MFPGIGTAFGTSAGEREVLQMESTEIFFQLSGARGCGGELLICAALESHIEALAGKIPRRGTGFGKETIDNCAMGSQERGAACAYRNTGGGVLPIFGVLFHTWAQNLGCARVPRPAPNFGTLAS